ncbi:hypothetical protein TSARBOMBA_236 [Bacillus phage TsarBomba]|uniref:Uncharacterized protein n=1 Tax=Bacillus phage TsarBomba TaxID=1690456 RepID=A0A0K2D0I4_9CAUD|nr:hypothetical protein TSARBOMBA_236 [Bacillus phage TsarBomba]ALA13106.1 hypothetical protein TSARBOMBA_236 [Bacillus phage TsarBomba]
MAIVGDYMVYGNCPKCGKYLANGTMCCDALVKSNYSVWLDGIMNKKQEANSITVVTTPRIGIKFIKEIMEQRGKEYYGKLAEENKKIRETYPLAFAKDRNNPAYYHIILTELFNNNLVTLEQYEAITESIHNRFSKQEE